MKKIFIAMSNLSGGGAEKVLSKILEKTKFKKNITMFLFYKNGIYLDSISKEIEITYLFSDRIFKSGFFFRLECILKGKILFFLIKNIWIFQKICGYSKKNDIEISFIEGYPTTFISQIKSTAKKIAWVHIDLEKHRTMSIEKEREVYRQFDRIICVSKASKQSVLNLYPEYKDKIQVIYNPIDKEEIIKKSKEKILDMKKGKINLVTVGRLSPQKGYDLLLQAHKKLLEDGLDYNLIIIGEGELKEEFENYISQNNISSNTQLLGFKSNPYPYIAKGDIFIVSSRYEGYSLVLAEALTLGKPIISTKCAGPTELLDNGKYGLLIPTENIKILKDSIKEMVENLELRKKYAKLAKERSKIFNLNSVMKQIEDLFDER